MTRYAPQDQSAGGSNYGGNNSYASNQDYYGQQTPSYGEQPQQQGHYGTPGSQQSEQLPQQGYSQPSHNNEPNRNQAQSYYGSNHEAYQPYPHDYTSPNPSGPPQGGDFPPHYQQQAPPYQSQSQYGGGYGNQQHQQYPPQPSYGSSAGGNHTSAGGNYDQGYRQDTSQPPQNYSNQPYGNPNQAPYGQQPNADDRGLMGAIGGGAAGGFAGHKMNHGILGTLGGAIAGSMLEDKFKDKDKKQKKQKKEKKHKKDRRGSSSSSSSSSDSGKSHGPVAMAGNFSASSHGARLEDDGRILVANCRDINGHQRESRIDLNDCLTNTNGDLRWARGGNFRPSAKDVRLVDGGKVLEADLGDGRGGWVRNYVRLDERIGNDNGRLTMV